MSDDLFARLRAAYGLRHAAPPPGFKSRRQLSSEWGLGRHKTDDLIRIGMANGMLEKVNVIVDGRVVPHYGAARKQSRSTRPST